MDFSAILDRIYTKEQSIELIRVLDRCASCAFRKDDKNTLFKDVVPHHLYSILKPVLERKEWKTLMDELRETIINMPIMTVYTPFTLSENTIEEVVEYIREIVSEHIFVFFIQKQKGTSLAIEWQGKYGEF